MYKFLKVYDDSGSIQRRPGSGRLSKITSEIRVMVEAQMQKGEAYQLHRMLTENGYDIFVENHAEVSHFPRMDIQMECVLPVNQGG